MTACVWAGAPYEVDGGKYLGVGAVAGGRYLFWGGKYWFWGGMYWLAGRYSLEGTGGSAKASDSSVAAKIIAEIYIQKKNVYEMQWLNNNRSYSIKKTGNPPKTGEILRELAHIIIYFYSRARTHATRIMCLALHNNEMQMSRCTFKYLNNN